jgi:transposase-like protein
MAQKQELNLGSLVERFHSEDACVDYIEGLRWPNGLACLRCGSMSVSRIKTRGQYDCNSCRYRFSVRAGTIFHDSHLPLWKWFLTTYMMIESKKGVSANQIKRTIGVSYKTAWYLCHRIRKAMTEHNPELLDGTVEVDETYVGGKVKGKGARYTGNKTLVAGAVERDGDVRLQVIPNARRATLKAFIEEYVAPDAERIITDELASYKGIGDHDTRHETVNHSIGEYVRGDIYTNTVENIWSLFKRSVNGAYHHLSEKHMDAYLDELEWRFNNRDNPWLFRDTLLKLISSENLPYQQLTA